MQNITVSTRDSKQVVDITERVAVMLEGKSEGVLHLFVQHTTCALTTADLDPGTDLDMLDAYWEMIPKLNYRHPHDPSHVPAHILASAIGPDVSLPFRDGKLLLGTWQRVVLIEFDGPRDRTLSWAVLKAAA